MPKATNMGSTVLDVVKSMVEWTWHAPEPLCPHVFPDDSVAVYIPVKAKHRLTCTFEACTFVYEELNGDSKLAVSMVGDKAVVVSAEAKLPQDEHRFYFQPSFGLDTAPSDTMVVTTLCLLRFSAEEIEVVRNNVSSVNTGGPNHIVLVMVANDSPYEDLSAHLNAPDPFKTDDDLPNMMAIPLDKFVAGASTKFIAPRMNLVKKREEADEGEADKKE
eukprot:7379849-Prymnesium_polylepis.2